jgi:flagellar hook-associated protein 3 FlgL
MAVSESGQDVFMQVRDAQGNITGQSMFDTIKNLIDIVDPASGMNFTVAELETVRAGVKSTIDHVANTRASLGARLNALDGLTTTAKDIDYLYSVRLSELQDLDFTEAISRFSRYQTQLEATQLTFKQTSQLSLFNIL